MKNIIDNIGMWLMFGSWVFAGLLASQDDAIHNDWQLSSIIYCSIFFYISYIISDRKVVSKNINEMGIVNLLGGSVLAFSVCMAITSIIYFIVYFI